MGAKGNVEIIMSTYKIEGEKILIKAFPKRDWKGAGT